ncbi:sensor histidine kinase [Novosphingobium umbonatum]|uniref:histidine kinase n=1 Tax=Novosphingobium umbonatum TaxID=1908524 RepID=A0A437N2G7_9SPHN|nr:ATP-binding protein [Novosphingobium umbonatum]RVU04058.1 sensor histidine kinase [Novosphingobium umbonatum]
MIRARSLRPWAPLLIVLLLALLAAWGSGLIMQRSLETRLLAEAASDARLRQALLDSEIARYRLLPLALADDRDVVAASAQGHDHRLSAKLEHMARETGAAVLYVIAPDGRAIAASNWRKSDSFVGRDYTPRDYFHDAQTKGAGEQFSLGTVSHRPGLYLARRTGRGFVVVVKLEFDAVEAQWRRAGGETFVTDADGVILVTSRPAWRFTTTRPLPAARQSAILTRTAASRLAPAPFAMVEQGRFTLQGAPPMVMVGTQADGTGWRVHLALPQPQGSAGLVRLAKAGAGLLVLVLSGALASLRRRRALARAQTAALEEAVAIRTAELRREMDERAALETRASTLREGLRQANRLATLGQVAASVAHETAQPVAAIRNYAQNAQSFLARDDKAEVEANLAAIDRLATRIGLVTAELRGFARKGGARADQSDTAALRDVVEGACLLLKERLSHVAFIAPTLPPTGKVRGHHVRLEQVLVNLMQNALEAMEGLPKPRLTLALRETEERIILTLSDNGPGIAPDVAQRLFTPFTTSRPSGLGLGLVIAQDIMQDLGGALRLVPSEEGAAFEIEMLRA